MERVKRPGHSSSATFGSLCLNSSFGVVLSIGPLEKLAESNQQLKGAINLQLCEVQIPLCTKQITVFTEL